MVTRPELRLVSGLEPWECTRIPSRRSRDEWSAFPVDGGSVSRVEDLLHWERIQHASGVLHHIIIRGIERRAIFRDDFDRDNFLERLSILVPETQTNSYAWVFMSDQKKAWQETDYVLLVFGNSPAADRHRYATYRNPR